MIDFTCPDCGQSFSVPDNAAGRRMRCRRCGLESNIPAARPAVPVLQMTPMRLRRLRSDHEQMRRAFANWPLVKIEVVRGDPPDFYVIEYMVKGLEKFPKVEDPILRVQHRVEVQLISEYPHLGPKCRMLTPVFHPNIDAATICVGDHWTAGERLVDLVVRIGEMIAYQDYNIKSPLNGEAAMWADLHAGELPIDARTLRPPEVG